MKFLNDNDYKSLKEKADSFDSIVNAIVGAGEEVSAADVTAETVIEALQADHGETADAGTLQQRVTELEGQVSERDTTIEELQSQVSERDTTIGELNTRIADFEGAPAEDPAQIIPEGEPSSKEEDIAAFANKNKGDTRAILEQCKKEGLI
jgi:TolA-binding protein